MAFTDRLGGEQEVSWLEGGGSSVAVGRHGEEEAGGDGGRDERKVEG